MGFSPERIENIKKVAVMARLGSLDSPVKGMEEGVTACDGIASAEDMEGEVFNRIQEQQLKRALWGCVDALEPRQAEVMHWRYEDGMTLKEISQEYGTTPEAVRQIHNKALRELRKPRYSKQLRPFIPESEQIYSLGLIGNGAVQFNRTWTSSTERVALDMVSWEERRREHMELLEKVRQRVEGA